MDDRCLPSKDGDQRPYRLAVCRIAAGEVLRMRLLATPHNGLVTHWRGKRSDYCPGEGICPPADHRKPRTWKGYVAAEVWLPDLKKWGPVCFELSEQLELDMRGVAKRGQVWEVTRALVTDESKPPVMGHLVQELDPTGLQAAFPLLACLQAFYHSWDLTADVKNPMPPRTYVKLSDGAPPIEEPKPEETGTDYEKELLRIRRKHAALVPDGKSHGPTSIGSILRNGKH